MVDGVSGLKGNQMKIAQSEKDTATIQSSVDMEHIVKVIHMTIANA